MRTLLSVFRLLKAFWYIFWSGLLHGLQAPPSANNFVRYFIGFLGWLAPRPRSWKGHQPLNKLARRLGPSYIKLGQFLATRPDLIGASLAERLLPLQDRLAYFPQEAAIKRLERSFNLDLSRLFYDFSRPVAAASVAQVHQGTLLSAECGERAFTKVAVKIIRPGVRRRFKRDLGDFYLLARLIERLAPASRRLKPVGVVRIFEHITLIEMDLRLEAAAICEMRENAKDNPDFSLPQVVWERTNKDVLTLEWIDGIKISDMAGLEAYGVDRVTLANKLMQTFLTQALCDGFFHADMHAGNLFVTSEGKIVAIDLGITGRLSAENQTFLAKILYGFIVRDYIQVAQVHIDAGYVPAHHDVHFFAQALRAIIEPIHGKSADQLSMGALLGLLFEVTRMFDMETQLELLLLQKTMVMVEGTARQLDPNFNLWESARPIVEGWIKQNLGPSAYLKKAEEALKFTADYIATLPAQHQKWWQHQERTQQSLQAIQKTLARHRKTQSFMVLALVASAGTLLYVLA